MKALLLSLLLALTPSLAVAEATPCTTQVYGDFSKELDWHCPVPNEDVMVPKLEINNDSVPLVKGAPAPFAGILLDQNRIMALGLRITGLRRLLWIELKIAKQHEDLEVARTTEIAAAEAQSIEAQNQALIAKNAQLEATLAVEQTWYRTWTFGFVLGVVLTTTAAVSLAVAVK